MPRLKPRALVSLAASAACVFALAACGTSRRTAPRRPPRTASPPRRSALRWTTPRTSTTSASTQRSTTGISPKHAITPQIIPYAETPAETLIQSGRTDLGITYPPEVVINRAKGLKYKAVAALVASNTTALAVLASSNITRPSQLSGKLYGGFGIASDKPIISAIIAADGAGKPGWREVVLNTDVIQALSSHRIDYTAVFGGIDNVEAELQGVKLRLFPYSTYLKAAGNFPNAVFAASDEDIEKRGPALKGALAALAEGYEFAAANPQQAAEILIKENETALGKSQTRVRDGESDGTAIRRPLGQMGNAQRRRLRRADQNPRERRADFRCTPNARRGVHELAAADRLRPRRANR